MQRDVTVREVMDMEYVGVSESDRLTETVELMLAEGTESVVVLRGTEPVGVVTERDALEALVGDEEIETVADAMTDTIPTVSPDHTIGEAADEMSATATKHVLVSDGDQPVGVLSEHDLITTSPFAPAVGAAGDATQRAVTGVSEGRGEPDAESDRPGPREFEDQSICERCGALSRDLSAFNGQLLCPDCRDI